MTYHFATCGDCRQVHELICQLEEKQLSYEVFSRIWNVQRSSPHYLCLVCEEDGHLLGMVNLRFEEQLHHDGRIAEITEMYVRPSLRSKGIGKALIQRAYEISREKGCLQIEACCNQLRLQAHRFYLREGMKNYHFKFTRNLQGNVPEENTLGV